MKGLLPLAGIICLLLLPIATAKHHGFTEIYGSVYGLPANSQLTSIVWSEYTHGPYGESYYADVNGTSYSVTLDAYYPYQILVQYTDGSCTMSISKLPDGGPYEIPIYCGV